MENHIYYLQSVVKQEDKSQLTCLLVATYSNGIKTKVTTFKFGDVIQSVIQNQTQEL